MPEGDTIWRTAATLRHGLEGKRVLDARPDMLKRLAGTTITEVKPVGKHLLIRFDNGLAIHSHMRMQGAWHLYKRGERWRRPAWQMKALLETDDVVAVCFGAPVVDLVRDETTKIGHLGPDILSDDWSVSDVGKRARAWSSGGRRGAPRPARDCRDRQRLPVRGAVAHAHQSVDEDERPRRRAADGALRDRP